MKNFTVIFTLIAVVFIIGLVFVFFAVTAQAPAVVEDDVVMCAADAMQCSDGTFVGRTGENCEFVCPVTGDSEEIETGDIQVDAPAVGEVVTSPLVLSGQAKGFWYFEASAPVEILDWEGNVIATSFVTAQGDWMTEDFVPFTGNISFISPYTPGDPVAWKQGSIVFKKDNPSGLPENDAQFIVPIQFAL
jgi:hypothetical protein